MCEDFRMDTGMDFYDSSNLDESSDIEPIFEPIEDYLDGGMSLPEDLDDILNEQNLSDLQDEADALEIEAIDEPSARSNIGNAFLNGFNSEPSLLAQLGAEYIAPHGTPDGTVETLAQSLQGGAYAATASAEELMAGTINTYGRSPSAIMNEIKIGQAIDSASEHLSEPLLDNEDYYNEEGIMITDESLRE